MTFNKVNTDVIAALRACLDTGELLTDPEDAARYGHDETEDLSFPPEIVLRPRSTAEVARIVSVCAESHIPITPIGGRTGLSGGALVSADSGSAS